MVLGHDFQHHEDAESSRNLCANRSTGNSGSPVLRQADGVAIGVHVYGGAYNSASVIGKFGNPVSDYIRAFGLPLPDNGGLNFINTAEAASAPNGVAPAAKSGPPESSLQAYAAHVQALEYAPEGFIDLLKSVVRVGAPILGGAGSVVPIFNPILGPISSLVGVAVDSALKVTTESSQEGFFDSFQAVGKKFNATSVNIPAAKRTIGAGSAMESSIDPPSSEQAKPADPKADKAAISRAVLREAALQAILSKDLKPEVQESLFEMIRDIVKTTVPIIEKVLPVLTPAAAVAVDSFIASQNAKGQTESSTESYSSNEEAFLSNLQKAQSKSKKNGESFVNAKGESSFQNGVVSTEEGMFDFIGDAVRSVGKIGQIVGVPIIGTVGNIVGLQGMGQIAAGGFKYVDQAGRLISAESSFESQPEGIFDTLRNIGDFAINRGPGLIRMGGTVLIGGGKGSIDPSLLGIARSGIIASAGMESALQTTRSTHGEEESSFAIGKGSRFSGAESSSDPPQSSPSPTYTAISLVDLIKRAFFAEAALQAVLKVDPKLLNQEEGWFDDLSDAVSDIGNSIGNTAEQVANGAAQAGQQVFDTVKNGVESAADAAARAAVQASIEKAQRGERQWMRRGE